MSPKRAAWQRRIRTEPLPVLAARIALGPARIEQTSELALAKQRQLEVKPRHDYPVVLALRRSLAHASS
jgi:hypothetical protein